MISIIFAVGCENHVSVLSHPDRDFNNGPEIEALYTEIEAGCPRIRNYNLYPGVFRAGFSKKSDRLENLCRVPELRQAPGHVRPLRTIPEKGVAA